ncbi:hypothetical protein [Streptomyces alkaliterrae]|uniref:Serine/threonine protein kinase n=1 Tax=Streptomyces alkaliterrae TaxID=2213162 RepID=A0A5P0YTV2_9ACTN|nr:hypothetical protein [Streptomyces alkaliterrae]MBB1255408.1 hypothetical protein [Streptomyces alkaliterrae]MBB1261666.1 hypothetical protein [Streptomyces alkaliterrae]MQS03741.1 hypothetical protein [Streptomyces alkaliterrae]
MHPHSRAAGRRRASGPRAAALTAVVVLAAVLPLAASAAGPESVGHGGPVVGVGAAVESVDGRPGAGPLKMPPVGGDRRADDGSEDGTAPSSASDAEREADGTGSVPPAEDAAGPAVPGEDAAAGTHADPAAESSAAGPRAVCGPQVGEPEVLTAQTCVLEQGDETWARAYYRNASGEPLPAVLSLLRPDGRSLQVHCELDGSTEPGTCETPRQRSVRAIDGELPYTAVLEVASPDGERLLLRSGSNSPETLES